MEIRIGPAIAALFFKGYTEGTEKSGGPRKQKAQSHELG
jgi:hypothetical protein